MTEKAKYIAIRWVTSCLMVLAVVAVAFFLCGCHSVSTQNSPAMVLSSQVEPSRIEGNTDIWAWSTAAKSLKSLVPEFNRKYPHVKVNVDMTGFTLQSRFLLSLAAGVGAPDVSQVPRVDVPKYSATGRLTDLTPVAMKYQNMFPASVWDNCTRNGRVYAIPWDIGPCAVFYKRDIFKRYGIDPNSIETWDDYIAAGRKIVAESGGKTKMLPMAHSGLITTFEMLIQQTGGQVFDGDGRIAINSNECLQALDVIKRLKESGICAEVAIWGQEFMAGLKSDTIATYPNAVWFGGAIKDTVKDYAGDSLHWGVFRLPAVVHGGLRTSNQGGSVLAIPDQCTQKEAAWAFIEFALCTRYGQATQYKNFDLFPAFMPALKDPLFAKGDPFYGNQKVGKLFSQNIEKIPTLYRTGDWSEALGYVNQALTHWASTGEDSRELLKTLERKLAVRLGREISSSSLSRSGRMP